MKTECINCNTEIDVKANRLRNNKRVTCSHKCASEIKKKKGLNYQCEVCNKPIHLKPFHKKIYKGPFTCSKECRGELLKTVYLGNKNPNHKYNDSVSKFLGVRCKDVARRAKSKKLDFNLTPDYLYEMYLKQNGLCSYTGIPLKLGSINFKNKGQADLDSLSIDKINPELGYIQGNITLCCNSVNKFKGNADFQEFNDFLRMLSLKSFGTCDIKIKKIRENAQIPNRAKLGDGGFDVTAALVEDTGDQIRIYTGIACQPSFGWVLLALPRSSICKKGLVLSNSIGLIDNQYTGEIMAVFNKIKPDAKIEVGERIIQLMPYRIPFVQFQEVTELSETDRGEGGFGSTNVENQAERT